MATQVWAHRGASAYAPENTMDAFILAYEMGAQGVELDVHLSADGHVIVAHDDTLERVSDGRGYIKDRTLAELRALRFSAGLKEFPDARMPTLEEVYAFAAPRSLIVNVELKTNEFEYEGLAKKLIDLERSMGMAGLVWYSSFNHYSLLEVREADPGARIGLLYGYRLLEPWRYAAQARAEALHPEFRIPAYFPGYMGRCRDAGVRVHPYTPDSPKDIERLVRLGVDAVITNRPDVALEVVSHAAQI